MFGCKLADEMSLCDMVEDPAVAVVAMDAYKKDGSGPLGMAPLVCRH